MWCCCLHSLQFVFVVKSIQNSQRPRAETEAHNHFVKDIRQINYPWQNFIFYTQNSTISIIDNFFQPDHWSIFGTTSKICKVQGDAMKVFILVMNLLEFMQRCTRNVVRTDGILCDILAGNKTFPSTFFPNSIVLRIQNGNRFLQK